MVLNAASPTLKSAKQSQSLNRPSLKLSNPAPPQSQTSTFPHPAKWPGQVFCGLANSHIPKKTSHSRAILSTQSLLDQISPSMSNQNTRFYVSSEVKPITIIKVLK